MHTDGAMGWGELDEASEGTHCPSVVQVQVHDRHDNISPGINAQLYCSPPESKYLQESVLKPNRLPTPRHC
jgi:hypothetical protein